MRVVRILGIDPGSRLTGYGIVDLIGNQVRHITHGTLRLSNTGGRSVIPLEDRLLSIHEGLSVLIEEHRPKIMSIEKVFFAKNALSALKLGQARGATILSAAIHGLEVVEYSPSEVKAVVTGSGAADKHQVAKMVSLLVGARDFATTDASDGLALAICHAHMIANLDKRAPTSSAAGVAVARAAKGGKKRRMSLAESLGLTPESVAARKPPAR